MRGDIVVWADWRVDKLGQITNGDIYGARLSVEE